MGTVVIAGSDYTIYGEWTGAGSATAYLGGMMNAGAAAWRALGPDDQKRTLIEATRLIDRQVWQGAPTAPDQALAWPRTGVIRPDGTAVSSATVPYEIINGTYELAAALAGNPDVAAAPNGSSNIKRLKAGSAEIEYFRYETSGPFPMSALSWFGYFLLGSGASAIPAGAYATGTDIESAFNDEDDYNLNRSY